MSPDRYISVKEYNHLYDVKVKARRILEVLRRADFYARLGSLLRNDKLSYEFNSAWDELTRAVRRQDVEEKTSTTKEKIRLLELED